MSQRRIAYVIPGNSELFRQHYQTVLSRGAAPDTVVEIVGIDMPDDQADAPLLPEMPFYFGSLFRAMSELQEAGTDGAIIGCSADPGLEVAKSFCPFPVVGPLEAALTFAQLRRWHVGIVVPGTARESREYRQLARHYDLDHVVETIEPVDLGYPDQTDIVKWHRDDPQRLREALLECHGGFLEGPLDAVVDRMLARSDMNAVYLGCTLWSGMAPLAERRLALPVIDPGYSALWLVESLAQVPDER